MAQQRSGRIGFSGRVSDPSDAAEVEARALAPAVARSVGASGTAAPATTVAGPDVHRAPAAGAPAADLGTVLSVPAMEALRRDATG